MKKVTKASKLWTTMSDEEKQEFLEFATPEVDEEEVEEEVVKEEKQETVEETKPQFITEDKLKAILSEVLGTVVTKEEFVETTEKLENKAKPIGATPKKPKVNEKKDVDINSLLAKVNGGFR